ncbi:type VI secretion system Vgr family protein [Paracoccus saliphilus]|uniref:Type VI secretion system secreted protein VgrG n=1 Tax=Paracoccus saliphilus TaxID=405559 RepID=A0AA45W7F8_9RHOB|nr:type VI secretion system tip protein TssI/VgrG [Paracoccus saliphilus]WCR02716.1 type VI secretion system tip protein VgrG [Paracoccus saliphilus]SIT09319.1 type VI secretion system secreted protein VgrG [Paracoccus saliphilus]
MNVPFKQAGRLGRLSTSLGENVLALLRFEGTDALNDLFDYRVEALSTKDDLDFNSLLGTHATVEIEGRDGICCFDGIVTHVSWAGASENGYRYNLRLQPWIALAGKRRNMRIWHNKTVDQILRELLVDYAGLGDPAFEIRLVREYPVQEYTVQHSETDLDFARRQLERHGISFYFRHVVGCHTLAITDEELNLHVIGEREFRPADGHHNYDREHFWEWKPERNLTTGAVRQTDYNFKLPFQKMETEHLGDAQHPYGQIEAYDWPGDYTTEAAGKPVTRMRTRQERGADQRIRAVGDCVGLSSGYRVKLTGDKVPGYGETHICLAVTHSFISEAYGSGGKESDGYSYSGAYTLMPDAAPMVPPKRTPLSRVYGPQTAMVVGEGEIDVDEYGRILVRFHWDLNKANSMRCRVSQSWAGNGWGGMVIPRVGMEVVVEFLEGDPDKPLVTGCVYNGKNKPPYSLPAGKTRATFKSDTHNGQGFNEIRFEDEKDEEEVFIHAQRDMNTKIEHHRTERVNYNKVESIGDSKGSEVHNVFSQVVGGDMRISVGPGHRGKLTPADASRTTDGIGGTADMIGGTIGDSGTGNLEVAVERDINTNIGRNGSELLAKVKSTSVGESYYIDVRKNFILDAGEQITLKCGQSVVTLDKGGNITVNGKVGIVNMDQMLRLLSDFVKINN